MVVTSGNWFASMPPNIILLMMGLLDGHRRLILDEYYGDSKK